MTVSKTGRLAPHVRFPFGVRGAIFSVMVVGLAAAMITAFTGAVFTDTATSSGNTFTAGTLELQIEDATNGFLEDLTAQYNVTAMAPGDGQVIKTSVKNNGNLDLRYALSITPAGSPISITGWAGGNGSNVTVTAANSFVAGEVVQISGATGTNFATFNHNWTVNTADATSFTLLDPSVSALALSGGTVASYGPLLSVLRWQIQDVTSGGTCTPGAEASNANAKITGGTPLIGTDGATDPTSYALISTSAAADGKVLGDPAPGNQTGDQPVLASSTQILCIKVMLPKATPGQPGQTPPTGYQNISGSLDFLFSAEQTKNN